MDDACNGCCEQFGVWNDKLKKDQNTPGIQTLRHLDLQNMPKTPSQKVVGSLWMSSDSFRGKQEKATAAPPACLILRYKAACAFPFLRTLSVRACRNASVDKWKDRFRKAMKKHMFSGRQIKKQSYQFQNGWNPKYIQICSFSHNHP